MFEYLLLPSIELIVACMCTVCGARLLGRLDQRLPLPLWLVGLSLATPLVWVALQAVVVTAFLFDPALHTALLHKAPFYLRDVVLAIGLKLWLCGAVCTAALALFRGHSKPSPDSDNRGSNALWLAGGAIASAIILPMAMDYWIDRGRLSGPFTWFTLACALLIGMVPVRAMSFALVRMGGVRAHLRYAEPATALFAVIIIWRGFTWHQALAGRPGAAAVIAVQVCTIIGVFTAWLAIRRGNCAAAAALARCGDNPPKV